MWVRAPLFFSILFGLLFALSLALWAATRTLTYNVTSSSGKTGNYLAGGGGFNGAVDSILDGNKEITGCGNWDCAPQPMDFAVNTLDSQSQAASAANGTYHECYQGNWNQCNRLFAIARYVYSIRVCNEWQINSECGPYVNGDRSHGEAIDPATWIAGVRAMIRDIKASPTTVNLKIAWDGPFNAEDEKYYPGNDVIDIINFDAYIGGSYCDGSSPIKSHCVWSGFLPVLNYQNNFAVAHGKPIGFLEWCDKFDDGYILTQFAQWMNTHNVVVQEYWDDPTKLEPDAVACAINITPAKTAAYLAEWGNYRYTGSYWPVVIPWPHQLHPVSTGHRR